MIINDDNAGPGSISIDKELATIQQRKISLEDASRYAQDPHRNEAESVGNSSQLNMESHRSASLNKLLSTQGYVT